MYLRHAVRRRGQKAHTYWRLVRSVRRGSKVVQETVAHLGELDAQGRAKAQALARQITGRGAQRELFEADLMPRQPLAVRLDQIHLERPRAFGAAWLGWTLWRALARRSRRRHRRARGVRIRGRAAGHLAASAVRQLGYAGVLPPGRGRRSSLRRRRYRGTALEDLLGVPSAQVNDDRLYRALDRLLPHKAAIEAHLKARLGDLFAVDYDLLLYDVTSTYFEGLAAANPQAQRGYSRDHRPDCKQVNIALVVTRGGLPLGYEVFAGNRADVTTVQEIVETMEKRYGQAQRIWVMDRGMTSRKNLAWLQATGRRYLIGTPRAELAIALVGPVTSVAIGLVGVVASLTLWEVAPPAAALGLWLATMNLPLGIFNLVPAYPLDGGRVLRGL